MDKKLEIIFVYRSNEGREVEFCDLVTREELMEFEDYKAENFWNTMGGIKITIEGFKTIYRSTNFYVLSNAVSFMMHSLYKLRNMKSEWFDEEEDGRLTIKNTANEIFQIEYFENNTLSISCFPIDPVKENKRGLSYFKGISINSHLWFIEAERALSEYFSVFSEAIEGSPDSSTVRIMKKYHDVFKKLSL